MSERAEKLKKKGAVCYYYYAGKWRKATVVAWLPIEKARKEWGQLWPHATKTLIFKLKPKEGQKEFVYRRTGSLRTEAQQEAKK